MRKRLRITIAALLMVTAAESAALAQAPARDAKRVALVIGEARYQHVPALANTKNDARLIATTLQGLGFILVEGGPVFDLDQPQLMKAVRDFGTALSGADVALFYYAGHGLQMQGANYLVPIDANPTKASDADFMLVDADIVLRQMEDSPAKLKLVILDACRNNPFGGRGLRDAAGGLAQMQAPEGTLIAYATQPGSVAADGPPNGDGPYAVALAAAMKKAGLGVFETFNEVALNVDRTTQHQQRPWFASSPIQGSFYFASASATGNGASASATVMVVPAPADKSQVELAYWDSIKDSRDAADFRAYLNRYPRGAFADLARNRLAAMTAPKPAAGDVHAVLAAAMAALQKATATGRFDYGAARQAIDAARGLDAPPPIPDAARQLAENAKAATQAAKQTSDYEIARQDFYQALALAPWWANSYYNLSLIVEALGSYGEAETALELYLRAARDAPDRAAVLVKINQLTLKGSQGAR